MRIARDFIVWPSIITICISAPAFVVYMSYIR